MSGKRIPRAPADTSDRAKAYWKLVLSEYELNSDELLLFRETVRVMTLIDQLAEILAVDGLIADGKSGPKIHPAEPALRANRGLLSRLVAQLALPAPETGQVVRSGVSFRAQHAAEARWRHA